MAIPTTSNFQYDASLLEPGSEKTIIDIIIGSTNQYVVANTDYLITNLVPGKSYELTTSVYNRGESKIYTKTEEYWPTSNISARKDEFTADDFIANIHFDYDSSSNVLTCDISNLSYTGNASYQFYVDALNATTGQTTFFKSVILGPYSTTSV